MVPKSPRLAESSMVGGVGRGTGRGSIVQSPRTLPDVAFSPRTHTHASGEVGRPARVGLHKTLQAGSMRNPMNMTQSASPWLEKHVADTAEDENEVGAGTLSLHASSSRAASVGGGVRGSTSDRGKSRATAVTLAGLGIVSSKQKAAAEESGGSPGMLQPQRIDLPSFLNMPQRRPDDEPPAPEERTAVMNRIQDLDHLIFACRRASKLREEGRAHFSLAVLRDNLGQYKKAIESYGHFLRICQTCTDSQGCALAYHCLGVDYQLLGQHAAAAVRASAVASQRDGHPAAGDSDDTLRPLPPQASELLQKAIVYHNKHREISDAVGKFVAHLNMGLAYATLGERESSTVNFQYALRYALQLQSLEGQSLAIGSLSFSKGVYENDATKMRALVERYADLCDALKQPKNQAAALRKLGILAGQQGNSEESIEYFQQAIKAARSQGNTEAEKDISVRIGIAAGHAKMAEHVSSILKSSGAGSGTSGANC